MNNFVKIIVALIVFIFVGREVTALTVRNNPSLDQNTIDTYRECPDAMARGGSPLGRIPLLFGKSVITKIENGVAYVDYYSIYRIHIYTVTSTGNDCKMEG